ncbi:MAG: enoyl-CoA hydratase/isomerase family protein [Thermodesulfobacteriota bacterium]
MPHYTRLIVERDGDFLNVCINRPGDRNSIDSILMDELVQMLETAEMSGVRVVVFSGSGSTYFIGGADGIEMMQCDPASGRAFSKKIQALFNRMEKSPLILVAAINGLCFGGGFEFALACDFRIVAESARIGLPEVKVGLIPGGGGTQRLPRLVGTGKAMQMILSGSLFPAQEAFDQGLVHLCVPDVDLEKQCQIFMDPILKNPQYALSQAKRSVKAAQNNALAEGLQKESIAFQQCFEHDFFIDLMCRQMDEGVLETTAKLPDALCSKKEKT